MDDARYVNLATALTLAAPDTDLDEASLVDLWVALTGLDPDVDADALAACEDALASQDGREPVLEVRPGAGSSTPDLRPPASP